MICDCKFYEKLKQIVGGGESGPQPLQLC